MPHWPKIVFCLPPGRGYCTLLLCDVCSWKTLGSRCILDGCCILSRNVARLPHPHPHPRTMPTPHIITCTLTNVPCREEWVAWMMKCCNMSYSSSGAATARRRRNGKKILENITLNKRNNYKYLCVCLTRCLFMSIYYIYITNCNMQRANLSSEKLRCIVKSLPSVTGVARCHPLYGRGVLAQRHK